MQATAAAIALSLWIVPPKCAGTPLDELESFIGAQTRVVVSSRLLGCTGGPSPYGSYPFKAICKEGLSAPGSKEFDHLSYSQGPRRTLNALMLARSVSNALTKDSQLATFHPHKVAIEELIVRVMPKLCPKNVEVPQYFMSADHIANDVRVLAMADLAMADIPPEAKQYNQIRNRDALKKVLNGPSNEQPKEESKTASDKPACEMTS